MVSPIKDSSRNITPSLFGLVGGALATLGFFLPWSGSGKTTASEWDAVIFYLTGKANFAGQSAKVASSLPFAFIIAIPLIFALVALVIGVIGIRVKNTALIGGLYGAAGIIGLVNCQVNLGYARYGYFTPYPSTTGLGLVVVNLGYFGIFIASIMSLAHYMKDV